MKTADVFHRKFDQVKLSRWHNFTAKVPRLQKYAGALFFALLVYGFSEQWFKSIYETPLGGESFTNIMTDDAGQI